MCSTPRLPIREPSGETYLEIEEVGGATRGSKLVAYFLVCSYACATRRQIESAPGRLEICKPTGNPPLVNPHGTDVLGHNRTLNGEVFLNR